MQVSGQIQATTALARAFPLDRKLSMPQSRSGRFGEESSSL
jgi:hypothetical protein